MSTGYESKSTLQIAKQLDRWQEKAGRLRAEADELDMRIDELAGLYEIRWEKTKEAFLSAKDSAVQG